MIQINWRWDWKMWKPTLVKLKRSYQFQNPHPMSGPGAKLCRIICRAMTLFMMRVAGVVRAVAAHCMPLAKA